MDPLQGRRDLLLAPLLAALPLAQSAEASPLNAAQTVIQPPAGHAWTSSKDYPERSV